MRQIHCIAFALLAAVGPMLAAEATTPVTIINIPPDPAIGNRGSIGSNTQLNLYDGGAIGANFDAGASSGTQNIEVNIYGGFIENQFFAGAGSVVTLYGGNPLGLFAGGNGSVVNIKGGGIGSLAGVAGNGVVNLFSGIIERSFSANFDSTVNIYGGAVEGGFAARGNAVVNIHGGAFAKDFNAVQNSAVHLFGRRFVLNGVEISKSMAPGAPLTILQRGVKLTGTFADGSLFDFDLNSGINYLFQDFFATTITLTATLVPEPSAGVIWAIAIAGVRGARRRRLGK